MAETTPWAGYFRGRISAGKYREISKPAATWHMVGFFQLFFIALSICAPAGGAGNAAISGEKATGEPITICFKVGSFMTVRSLPTDGATAPSSIFLLGYCFGREALNGANCEPVTRLSGLIPRRRGTPPAAKTGDLCGISGMFPRRLDEVLSRVTRSSAMATAPSASSYMSAHGSRPVESGLETRNIPLSRALAVLRHAGALVLLSIVQEQLFDGALRHCGASGASLHCDSPLLDLDSSVSDDGECRGAICLVGLPGNLSP
ncbi:hypothetical protein [Mesorhizobium sp. ES1-4]|uniref:hypothetical protein n=1 Tax=Mesorhizobium sp. ES1-4 TaxID=2876627 RepID=UPI001CCEB92C|nr:hypothetical protein [Mesorhizobium sp. ES1-4]MBZ9799450.1 hypothetical protein [Mesorhizobium sp. ES1-4]